MLLLLFVFYIEVKCIRIFCFHFNQEIIGAKDIKIDFRIREREREKIKKIIFGHSFHIIYKLNVLL